MNEYVRWRWVLAATFALQIGGMIAFWPPDPPPALPPSERSYDLNVLFDPQSTTTPTVCRPVDVLLDNPCGVPVLR